MDPGREFSSDLELVPTDVDFDLDLPSPGAASTEYLLERFRNAVPDVDRPLYRKDIYYTASVQALSQYHGDVGQCILIHIRVSYSM